MHASSVPDSNDSGSYRDSILEFITGQRRQSVARIVTITQASDTVHCSSEDRAEHVFTVT